MVQRSSVIWVAMIAIVVATAVPASAQLAAVPYAGSAFGGQANDGARPTFGGSVSWRTDRWLGMEGDVAWTGDLFRIRGITEPLFATSSVTTLMGNAIISLPERWSAAHVRPFGVAGLGAIHARIGSNDAFVRVVNTRVGVTLGAGATVDVGKRYGIRGDVRYLRALQTLESDSEFFSLGETHLTYWRATAGLSIRLGQ